MWVSSEPLQSQRKMRVGREMAETYTCENAYVMLPRLPGGADPEEATTDLTMAKLPHGEDK